MNCFKALIVTASAFVLTGCAASYRPVSPKHISYSTGAESDGLMMLYRYDVMRSAGNKKYARRAAAKGIRILAVEISNQSDRPITLRQDISISLNGFILS